MEFFNTNKNYKPTSGEYEKAGRLITKAGKLGMNLAGYGALDVNLNSGYVYLWLEDYSFTLYIDLQGNLKALFSCPYDGEETPRNVDTLAALERWCEFMYKKSDKKEGR